MHTNKKYGTFCGFARSRVFAYFYFCKVIWVFCCIPLNWIILLWYAIFSKFIMSLKHHPTRTRSWLYYSYCVSAFYLGCILWHKVWLRHGKATFKSLQMANLEEVHGKVYLMFSTSCLRIWLIYTLVGYCWGYGKFLFIFFWSCFTYRLDLIYMFLSSS